ncbi:probable disease resistance protein At5g63020 [Eucalyptus grandis]|uniref:probable disease resistance protein At5g63020 n=1 Tax=Eucalyptus grandis TaxID=71139 RepID=UPI00192EEC8C|nr:probable disease resistance protein At5g63020 [Eucalyptus grandis]XP_039157561.1 probable disease resistance protein At5g63020 [Eucalyptus grandis]
MPKEKDSFREYVEFLQNNKWKCNFCNKEYGGSVTRIKAHLAGVGGYGIHGCNIVNSEVRSEAQKALKGKGPVESRNGPEGNALGSSHPRFISSSITQGPHQPVNVSDEDACRETSFTAMPNPSFDVISAVGIGSSASIPLHETNVPSQSLLAQNMISQRDFSSYTQHPQSQVGYSIPPWNLSYPSSSRDLASEALINMPGPVNAEDGEPNTEVPQDVRTDDALVDNRPSSCGLVDQNTPALKRKLEELSNREADMDDLEAWCRKAERIKGEYWSMVQAYREGRSLAPQQIKRVDDFNKEVEDILGHFSFRKGSTTHAAGCRKSSPLVTTELVGKKSKKTIEQICAYLMKDEIFIIGICGMRGIGKTAILVHVHNRILESPAFNDVFWITVPHKFSVYKLQDEIANAVGLENLSKDKDVKRRAYILKRHLKDKRAVLILDDLWMHFKIEDVGIPFEKGALKLVLTTPSLDVCHKMLCQKHIKIDLLNLSNTWSLFKKKLCFGRELPSEIKEIARSILNKCEGLPLGIIEIATCMRGIGEVHEWKGMLWKLTNLKVELDVFKRLKLSYKNLGDSQVQQCLLHLIFCFEFRGFDQDDTKLIESFIDEGLLGGICTRQELHDQGYTILDKLRKGCLWDHTIEEEEEE